MIALPVIIDVYIYIDRSIDLLGRYFEAILDFGDLGICLSLLFCVCLCFWAGHIYIPTKNKSLGDVYIPTKSNPILVLPLVILIILVLILVNRVLGVAQPKKTTKLKRVTVLVIVK